YQQWSESAPYGGVAESQECLRGPPGLLRSGSPRRARQDVGRRRDDLQQVEHALQNASVRARVIHGEKRGHRERVVLLPPAVSLSSIADPLLSISHQRHLPS